MLLKTQFRDRTEAGRALGEQLRRLGYGDRSDVLVLGLPRGGVPVAYEAARSLAAPLDVLIVRKLGVPGREELAMGAIASGGGVAVNREVAELFDISDAEVNRVTRDEKAELVRRQREYRGDRPAPDVRGRTVILIDDGLATGSTMRAAAAALRPQAPRRIVVAVPVASQSTCDELRGEAEEVICLATPEPFRAVGLWYEDFSQTTDEEVRELLEKAWRKPANVEAQS